MPSHLQGFTGAFSRFSDWVLKMVCINLLWILFSLLGGILFGVFPSTVAMCAVVRKWFMGEEVKIFRFFWENYKTNFISSNMLMGTLFILGIFIYWNLYYSFYGTHLLYQLVFFFFCIIAVIYTFTLIMIFPVFVHYQLPLLHYIKNAMILSLSYPIRTIFMALGGFVIYLVLLFIPGLIPFFSVNLIAFISMLYAMSIFRKADEWQSARVGS
ncbi:YesL family protein [Alteribacter aurantiacus]|uniref:YesL family protein n=1 Tax=Alteribacter aurantiacus TaxID=254410 RepID=UPI0003F585EA|nr:YesL family protein [Alteribacter aurantiacus]